MNPTFEISRSGHRLHSAVRGDRLVRSFTRFQGSSVEVFDSESAALAVISSSPNFYRGCIVVKSNYLLSLDYYKKSLAWCKHRDSLTSF